ncbi:AMP-binding protein [Sphingopyxis sp.]|uniref:AMP-binding protein n=1 Tax=Sphingopyxis sp. TaxID=1908224 RepID=UPI003D6CCD63
MEGPDGGMLPAQAEVRVEMARIAREGAIPDYLLLAERWAPGRPLLSEGPLRLTYGDGCRLVYALASSLVEAGMKKGDRVFLCMPNDAVFPLLCNAVWVAGGAVVVASPLDPESVLAFKLGDCTPRMIYTQDDPVLVAKLTAANVSGVQLRLVSPSNPLGVMEGWPDAAGGTSLPTLDPADMAILQYTGGTTGTPKAVILDHRNITASVAQSHGALDFDYGDERAFAAAPFSHIAGLNILILACSVAAELTIINRFDPETAVHMITGKRLSYVLGVPTMFNAMLRNGLGNRADWVGCKYFISGGAPIPEEMAAQFHAATGHRLRPAYGLSETSPGVSLVPGDMSPPPGCAGLPLQDTEISIRALDDPAIPVAPGDRGEICVRGPQVMRGYWGEREENVSVFVEGGWLRTGDIGWIDANGYLFVVDRLKDIIIASGHNVYPAQVEEAIYAHPAIAEVAVVGAPHDYRGETVRVVAVLKPGAALDLAELQHFLSDRLSPIEMPRLLDIVAELPKSPAGKILRRALRDTAGTPTIA